MKCYIVILLACSALADSTSGDPRNKTCHQATYHVQQLYQACSPKGPIIQNAGGGASSRLDLLEEKYNRLESMYRELNAKIGGSVKTNIPRTELHNVTKSDGSFPIDCTEIFLLGYRCTGVYLIQPGGATVPFPAFCELSYEGWTLLMRRYDGSVDFYRTWNEYKEGFGTVSAEHWLGNDNIHFLTSQRNYELKIEFTYWANDLSYYALYDSFKLESEANKYKMLVSGYSGNSGYDGFVAQTNRPFSTKDRDNDIYAKHCAQVYKGAFWYSNCHNYSHPMGMYKASCGGHDCIEWKAGQAANAILMKVRAKSK